MKEYSTYKNENETALSASHFITKLHANLTTHSKVWRNLKSDLILHNQYTNSLSACRDEISLMLYQYVKQNTTAQHTILNEIVTASLKQQASVIFFIIFSRL
jgi:hypothetical protein